MASIAVVGAGWRSRFYIRLAKLMPDSFEIIGVVARDATSGERLGREFDLRTFNSVAQLLKYTKPDYVIVCVSWEANPEVVKELVRAGVFVLCETPPASNLNRLRELWNQVGSSEMVQVAEQYPRLPGHAARLELVRVGLIGEVSSVEVSSTHGYHAIALMRSFLGSGFSSAEVFTKRFSAPLVDPLGREGWRTDLEPQVRDTTIGLISFGSGKSALYNFVDNQWHNQLRHRRIVIRGSLGEISDDSVIRLLDGPSILKSNIVRYQSGIDLNLDGFDTEHLSYDGNILYVNRFSGLRLMDEELAIAQLMVQMADWVANKGEGPYPLAQACQDQMISLALDQSLREGRAIVTTEEDWAKNQ